jgi:hypothetical protein
VFYEKRPATMMKVWTEDFQINKQPTSRIAADMKSNEYSMKKCALSESVIISTGTYVLHVAILRKLLVKRAIFTLFFSVKLAYFLKIEFSLDL